MAIDTKNGSKATFSAKGEVPPPPKADQELGSARPLPVRDLVPELANRRSALLTYDKMARTDAVTSVSLQASKVSILGAQFYLDAESDDQIARDIAEFVSYNIFEGMSSPWTLTLSKILKMYQHGNAVFEPVYQNRQWTPKRKMANSKNYTMLRKLAYRPSLTIKSIEYDDNGGPVEIIQNAIRKDGKTDEVPIPIEKAIIFPFGDADNLSGESALRSAYPHWFYKTHLYKIDAIQKERHGIGIPRGTLPPGYTKEDRDFLEELLANLRTNERSFIVQPTGFIIDFAKPEGQLVNVLESASYHDVAIMLNVMAEFMMLGFGDSGSRATAGSQTDLFYKSQWFIAQLICDCFNMFLIPNLVRWNFDTSFMPKMKVRNIGQSRDLQQIASALANVFGQEILTADLETENWVRTTIFDMPIRTTPRPVVADTNMREQILLQGKAGGDPADPSAGAGATDQKGKASSNGGQGNMNKGPTDA